ncbi:MULTISPECIES: hypothetical protein [unclassified Methylobacterium]|jgi:hypothetical protein|uniref:hypothetical protein n=1 Tax=unclassified Methylobacterium TaxID=2615210 RepID=UPI000AEF189F|nr:MULTISPECIES: hypothetical protein [unclassified Methylobacterium]MBO1018923.1 hypothetical protein [Methylobacterium sp. SD274]
MSDSSQPPVFLSETSHAVPVPRVVQQAYFWVVSALGGLATIALLVFAVATQSNTDAERIAETKGRSSINALVGALAVTHGRPGSL